MTDKIDQNKLNCIECFQLSAAEQLCKEFPQLPVVLVPQQQSRPILQIPPAIFVQVFQVQRHKRLDGFAEWTLAVNFAYISKDTNATSEQQDAAVRMMDNIERIRPIEGVSSPYTIYNAQSKTVDGIVNITGTVSVWEQRTDERGQPAQEELLKRVKDAVKEEGDGIAPIGHKPEVKTVSEKVINLSATLKLRESAQFELIKPKVESALKAYIEGMPFEEDTIYHSKAIAAILDADLGIRDATQVMLNDSSGSVILSKTFGQFEVAKLGTVTLKEVKAVG